MKRELVNDINHKQTLMAVQPRLLPDVSPGTPQLSMMENGVYIVPDNFFPERLTAECIETPGMARVAFFTSAVLSDQNDPDKRLRRWITETAQGKTFQKLGLLLFTSKERTEEQITEVYIAPLFACVVISDGDPCGVAKKHGSRLARLRHSNGETRIEADGGGLTEEYVFDLLSAILSQNTDIETGHQLLTTEADNSARMRIKNDKEERNRRGLGIGRY